MSSMTTTKTVENLLNEGADSQKKALGKVVVGKDMYTEALLYLDPNHGPEGEPDKENENKEIAVIEEVLKSGEKDETLTEPEQQECDFSAALSPPPGDLLSASQGPSEELTSSSRMPPVGYFSVTPHTPRPLKTALEKRVEETQRLEEEKRRAKLREMDDNLRRNLFR